MYKIAVVGDYDSIYGFRSAGTGDISGARPGGRQKEFQDLAAGGYAVIYITEALAAEIEPEIDRYREQALPAMILIPGISGNTGKGRGSVKKSVEQAVGSDIIFGMQ